VFLSYASQDAEAARRICESLRTAGVEDWLDADGGLEHGDEWDAKIRRQIKECVLFIPLISANTQARLEGYFRIEWELAAQRALGIASGVAFILPIMIDDTKKPEALVPDKFRAVQWTRLKGGEMTPEVRARFLKVWSHRTGVLKHDAAAPAAPAPALVPARSTSGRWVLAAGAVVLSAPARFGSRELLGVLIGSVRDVPLLIEIPGNFRIEATSITEKIVDQRELVPPGTAYRLVD
jgi:hypothetical protein